MLGISPLRAVLLAITIIFVATLSYASVRVVNAADTEQLNAGMLDDYRVALQSLDRVAVYNEYVQELINNQEAAKSAVGQQLENYHLTKPEIVPLMRRMIESLSEFVEHDLPFNLEARRTRVQELVDNMGKSEMPIAEKFRQILDVYQAEMNYGRDIDATVGWIDANGPRREVTFLRVGRLVLVYQTHDRAETGFFNPITRQWELLPDEYRNTVAEGLRIAKKQAAPVLLKLPVPAPGVAD